MLTTENKMQASRETIRRDMLRKARASFVARKLANDRARWRAVYDAHEQERKKYSVPARFRYPTASLRVKDIFKTEYGSRSLFAPRRYEGLSHSDRVVRLRHVEHADKIFRIKHPNLTASERKALAWITVTGFDKSNFFFEY